MNQLSAFLLAIVCAFGITRPTTAWSQETTTHDFGLHITPFTYRDSGVKKDGFSVGLYTYLGIGENHSLETDIAYTRIDMDDLDELREWDYAARYTYYRGAYLLRGGLHYVSSNYLAVDGAVTLGGGVGYELNGRWGAALDGFFTYYNDESPDFKIYQLTPCISHYFLKTHDSGLRVQTRAYLIHTSMNSRFFEDDDYLSAEAELSWYTGSLTLRGFGWAGEQLFPVRENGLARYNLPDLLEGGYGAGIDYLFASGIRMRLETAMEIINESGIDQNPTLITLGLVFGKSF